MPNDFSCLAFLRLHCCHKYDDVFIEFAVTLRSDAEEFLKWHKTKYPKVYLMIF